jgi:hypothetical protein
MYWKENDDQDSIYVKNQRQWVQKNLDDNLGGQLHLHKNAVFFVMDEDDCFGGKHPQKKVMRVTTVETPAVLSVTRFQKANQTIIPK